MKKRHGVILSDDLGGGGGGGGDDDVGLQDRTVEVEERASLSEQEIMAEGEQSSFKKLLKQWHSTSSKLGQSDCLSGKFGVMSESLSVSLVLPAE